MKRVLTAGLVALVATGAALSASPAAAVERVTGVIYNAVTRAPVAGASLTLTTPGGAVLAPICLQGGGLGPTAADGVYDFTIDSGTDPVTCPILTDITIGITAAGHEPAFSVIEPPQAGPLVPPGGGGVFPVTPDATPPLAGALPPYYRRMQIEKITSDIVNNHIALDPVRSSIGGIVHDVVTGAPVANATVSLNGPSGAVPSRCFLTAGQQGQVTAADGIYRFDIHPGVDAACPDGADYTIAVVPNGFSPAPSSLLAPLATRDLVAGADYAPQAGAPAAGGGAYHLTFTVSADDQDVVRNHIPLDPYFAVLSGTVHDGAGTPASLPVERASVRVTGPSGALANACFIDLAEQGQSTAADGRYSIRLRLGADASCPDSVAYTVTVTPPVFGAYPAGNSAAATLALSPGTATADVPLTSPPLSVSGTVYEASGTPAANPVAGASVTILATPPLGVLPDACYVNPALRTVTTDASGAYTFALNIGDDPGCPYLGAYRITATPPAGGAFTGDNTVAIVVPELSGGGDRTGIDIPLSVLVGVPMVTISGFVNDADASAPAPAGVPDPIAGVVVTLQGPGGALPDICFVNPAARSQTTDASGAYSFTIIPDIDPACANGDSYTLRGVAPGTNGYVTDANTIVPGVTVAAGDVTFTRIALPRSALTVSGTVRDDATGAAVEGATVSIMGPSGSLSSVCLSTVTAATQRTMLDGAYRYVLNLGDDTSCPDGGTYSVTATPDPGAGFDGARSIGGTLSYAGGDVTDADIRLTRGAIVPVITSVSGTAIDGDTNQPVPGVRVFITGPTGTLAAACHEGGVAARPLTDASGGFAFRLTLGMDTSCPSGGTYQAGLDPVPGAVVTPSTPFALTSGTPYPGVIVTLRRLAGADTLRLTKRALTTSVRAGGFADYEIMIENTGPRPVSDVVIADTPPFGFSYVSGTAYRDGVAVTAASLTPPRFALGTVAAGSSTTLRYRMRVAATVPPGPTRNVAVAENANGASAASTGTLTVEADPLFDDAGLWGKVFYDCDADGWQDYADHADVVIRGGVPASSVLEGSVTVDTGAGPQMAMGTLEQGIALGTIPGYAPGAPAAMVTVRARLSAPRAADLHVISQTGTEITLDARGKLHRHDHRLVARGQACGNLTVTRTIAPSPDGGWDLTIMIVNDCRREIGVPGARVATVGGLVSETDRHGRYHIVGPRVSDQRRGTTLILKLDTASLPVGSVVTTENPRSLRTTGGMMIRMNFGVSCPAPAGFGREVFATLDPVCFYPGTAQIDPARRDALVAIAAHLRSHGGGEVQVACRPCEGEHNYGLNAKRALAVHEALAAMLPPEVMRHVRVTAQKTAHGRQSSLRGGGLLRAASLMLALLGAEAEAGDPGKDKPSAPAPIRDNPYLSLDELGSLQGGYLGVVAAPPAPAPAPVCPDPATLGPVSRSVMPPGCPGPVAMPVMAPPVIHYPVPPVIHQSAPPAIVYQTMPLPAPVPVMASPPPVVYNPAPVTPAFTIETRPRALCPEAACADIAASGHATLKNGAAVWASADAFAEPLVLGVRGPRWARLDGGVLAPVAFRVDSNYDAFIAEWEVAVFRAADHGRSRPLAVLPLAPGARKVVWDGAVDGRALAAGETLVYVVRAYGETGAMDVSAPRELLVTDAETPPELHGPRAIATAAPLISTIRPHGGTITVRGADVPPGWRAHVAGKEVRVADDGTFEWQGIGAPGAHAIAVVLTDPDGTEWTRELALEVAGDHLFMVGLADLMIGQDRVDGALEAISADDAFDSDLYTRGRLAFFLKGKIKGRYLITAQADTEDGDIEHLFDGFLDRRDPRSVFRRLDPDRYYPVYGDDSTTWSEVDTQGKMYVRLESDDSSFVWGNYNTGLTGTVLGRYSRSLYGARGELNLGGTRHGEPQVSVKAFASEPGSVLAHNEFLGTGGSLYYLRRQDIVTGSEKVTVEIREPETGRVLERIALVPGRDYQIDDLQGRIILARPLRQWAGKGAGTDIVERTPVDDDLAYLVVDYEYVPDGFGTDDLTAGGRALAWLGDYVGVGGTYVTETRDNRDYELIAADATLRYTPGTYLKAEYAESQEAQAGETLASADGGLYFDAIPAPGASDGGKAYRVDGRVSLVDLFDTAVEGDIAGWWARREGAFSTISSETRRFVQDYGATVDVHPWAGVTLSARATRGQTAAGDWSTIAAVQLDQQVTERIGTGTELRYDEDYASGRRARGWTAGVRLTYDVAPGIGTYIKGQTSFAEEGGFAEATGGAIGMEAAISDALSAHAEVAVLKDQGMGATLGLDYALAPDHKVYGSVTRSTDRTDARSHAFTIGQRRDLGKGWSAYSENQFGFRRDGGAEHGQSYGIDGALTEDATVGLSYQRAEITGTPRGDIERDTASASLRWKKARVEGSLRGEYRRDEGAVYGRRDQWLASARGKFALNEALTAQAEVQGSQTKNRDSDTRDAKFWETSVGLAWRPVYQDRLNALARYTWLYDLPSPDQLSGGSDKRLHVASAEAGWRVNAALDVALRGAHRRGEVRAARDAGGWSKATASFGAVRANWNLMHKWDVLAEYRGLYDHEAEAMRHGALLGVYRHFGDHFKLGAGYNFAAFSDDLTDVDGDAHGWFVNAVGTF